MRDSRDIVSLWLIPTEPDAARFQTVIDGLAAQQGAPRFAPHISLGSFVGETPHLDPLLSLLSGLVSLPKGVDRSAVFTTSLFVRFELTDQLKAARQWLEALSVFRKGRSFDPHISLCYGAPIAEDKVAAEIGELCAQPVRFDRLRLMRISVPVETHDDVARWSQLDELKF